MSNRFYSLKVQPDWASDKSIAVDVNIIYVDGVAVKSQRFFFPLSQCVEQGGLRYVAQWLIETKREEIAHGAIRVEDVNRGLSEVFDWSHHIEQADDRPAQKASVVVDVKPILEIFEKASEHLKYPKIKIETGHGKVVFKRAGERSKRPGVIYVTDGGPFGDNKYYGFIGLDGEFHSGRDCGEFEVSVVVGLANDPSGYAAAYGQETGSCCFCARELTDKRSVSVGYGPVCADHFGLPWGVKEEEVA